MQTHPDRNMVLQTAWPPQVDVAELRQKLQSLDALEREVELLRRQKAASEEAALDAKQKQGSGGVWGWLVGTPPDDSES